MKRLHKRQKLIGKQTISPTSKLPYPPTITMRPHTSHTALFVQTVYTLHFCLHSHWFSTTYAVHISQFLYALPFTPYTFVCTLYTICTASSAQVQHTPIPLRHNDIGRAWKLSEGQKNRPPYVRHTLPLWRKNALPPTTSADGSAYKNQTYLHAFCHWLSITFTHKVQSADKTVKTS